MKSDNYIGWIFSALLCGTPLCAQVYFTNIADSAGMNQSIAAQGVCVFDFNGDGREDIFVANSAGPNHLYKNLGGMQFAEVAATAGVALGSGHRLGIAGDYDNDGDADLFIGVINGPSYLFRNNGDETFSDVTQSAGISNNANLHGALWLDYDGDGWLDLYLSNYSTENQLCRNLGNGTFADIAAAMGAEGPTGLAAVLGHAALDYDRDGDADIFLTQDGQLGNVLLRQEQNGHFSDVSDSAGVVLAIQGMGVAVGDYNRDGWPDIHIANMHQNSLLENQGNGTFLDVAAQAGVEDTLASMGWGTFFFDADNDGWPDLYTNNTTGFGQVPNKFYRNLGNGHFEDLSVAANLDRRNDGVGAAWADFDNDGDLDMVLVGQPSVEGAILLLRNDSQTANHFVQFDLLGVTSNRDAIGAILELRAATGVQHAFCDAGGGYASQNFRRMHFGLGSASVVDSLFVFWPGGAVEKFGPFAAGQRYLLRQGEGLTAITETSGPVAQHFALQQNYPNPFNGGTVISYRLPVAAAVTVQVFDLRGKLIETLFAGRQGGGEHHLSWNPQNLASGIYFYRLSAEGFTQTRRALYLK